MNIGVATPISLLHNFDDIHKFQKFIYTYTRTDIHHTRRFAHTHIQKRNIMILMFKKIQKSTVHQNNQKIKQHDQTKKLRQMQGRGEGELIL